MVRKYIIIGAIFGIVISLILMIVAPSLVIFIWDPIKLALLYLPFQVYNINTSGLFIISAYIILIGFLGGIIGFILGKLIQKISGSTVSR